MHNTNTIFVLSQLSDPFMYSEKMLTLHQIQLRPEKQFEKDTCNKFSNKTMFSPIPTPPPALPFLIIPLF